MTKIGQFLIGFVAAMLIALPLTAARPHGNEHGNIKATINGAHISIDYGRRSRAGTCSGKSRRASIGGLAPTFRLPWTPTRI